MATFISHSPAETEAFAESIGRRARPGLVLGLVGDLGAGKTQFVKGLARGLGIQEPVLSPTFALLHSYHSGRLPLVHIDLYRLDTQEQIVAAGLEEAFTAEGVTVIEWWDRWRANDPPNLSRIDFVALGDTERRITYVDPGP